MKALIENVQRYEVANDTIKKPGRNAGAAELWRPGCSGVIVLSLILCWDKQSQKKHFDFTSIP